MAYETSDLYKEAIEQSSRTTYISGQLVTESGMIIDISNDEIDSGSFYITNQCVSNDAFSYGAVFAAEAGITLKTDIDRYSLYDASIQVNFNILLSSGEYETIPLGKFYVNEPNRVGKNVSIKAYDGMILLDKEFGSSMTGTPYELLNALHLSCKVELSQSQAEIEALTNGSLLLSADANKVSTYRDLLSYIAQVTCTFAIFDRTGKLKLCEYGTSSVKTISADNRTSSKFSDFETYYSSIKAYFVVDASYKAYGHVEEGSGLIYDMGKVPIVQGLDETNQQVLDNIFSKLSNVRYTPCEITYFGDPALDLGDMITNVDRDGNKITSLITFYKWSYRGKHQIKSAGSNPKLASAKEKTSKEIVSLQSEIASKTIVISSATNAKQVTLGQEYDDIATLNFSVSSACKPICIFTVQFSIDIDGYVEFSLYNGLVALENATYKGYYLKGEHFATFMFLDSMSQNERRSLRVLAKCYADTESDARVQIAKIKTLENGWKVISSVSAGDIFPQDKSMWEQGGLASEDGSNIDSTTRIRSCFVPIKAGQKYKCIADTSHNLLTRLYTANKTYRDTTTNSFASADFEFTTDATDKYIRFVIRNSDDSNITTDELDNVCWTCEPVIEVEEVAVDTTEPTVTIQPFAVRAIAYTQGINGGKGEWDGTLEFKDVFGADIPLISDMSVVTFGTDVSVNTQVPMSSNISVSFGTIPLNSTLRFISNNITERIRLGWNSDSYTWRDVKGLTWNEVRNNNWQYLKGDGINGNADN